MRRMLSLLPFLLLASVVPAAETPAPQWVVVTALQFRDAVNPLAEHRKGEGFRVVAGQRGVPIGGGGDGLTVEVFPDRLGDHGGAIATADGRVEFLAAVVVERDRNTHRHAEDRIIDSAHTIVANSVSTNIAARRAPEADRLRSPLRRAG